MTFFDCFDYDKPLSLYVHVPFCKKKCSYCAFYSKPCVDDESVRRYACRIVKEIGDLTALMKGKPFHTAYIGGGNPGVLTVRQLEDIARAVCKNGRPVEFTVEMNPESLKEEHFHLFEDCFTRMSMGVQSLNERGLNFLGRNSSLSETFRGIDLSQRLRVQTCAELNYDIITCLPAWHDYMSDIIRIAEKYAPDHISLYALTLEEGTPLHLQNPILPASDEQAEILSESWKILDKLGYEHYEVSNFARKGERSGVAGGVVSSSVLGSTLCDVSCDATGVACGEVSGSAMCDVSCGATGGACGGVSGSAICDVSCGATGGVCDAVSGSAISDVSCGATGVACGGVSGEAGAELNKNSKKSIHNSVYWAYRQYAGLGASAASTGFKNGEVYRVEASVDYRNWNYEISHLTGDEALTEFVMMGLRHSEGLDLKRLERDFHRVLDQREALPSGYGIVNDHLVPNENGFLTADYAALAVLERLIEKGGSERI